MLKQTARSWVISVWAVTLAATMASVWPVGAAPEARGTTPEELAQTELPLPGDVRVAILPFWDLTLKPENVSTCASVLFSHFANEGFDIIHPALVGAAVAADERPPTSAMTQDDAVRIGSSLGADWVVFGSINELRAISSGGALHQTRKGRASIAVNIADVVRDKLIYWHLRQDLAGGDWFSAHWIFGKKADGLKAQALDVSVKRALQVLVSSLPPHTTVELDATEHPYLNLEKTEADYRNRPDDPMVALAYCQALLTAQRVAEARSTIEAAAQGTPEDAEIQYWRGVVALAEGDDAQAIGLWQTALRLQFDHEPAQQGLQMIGATPAPAQQAPQPEDEAHATAVPVPADYTGVKKFLVMTTAGTALTGHMGQEMISAKDEQSPTDVDSETIIGITGISDGNWQLHTLDGRSLTAPLDSGLWFVNDDVRRCVPEEELTMVLLSPPPVTTRQFIISRTSGSDVTGPVVAIPLHIEIPGLGAQAIDLEKVASLLPAGDGSVTATLETGAVIIGRVATPALAIVVGEDVVRVQASDIISLKRHEELPPRLFTLVTDDEQTLIGYLAQDLPPLTMPGLANAVPLPVGRIGSIIRQDDGQFCASLEGGTTLVGTLSQETVAFVVDGQAAAVQIPWSNIRSIVPGRNTAEIQSENQPAPEAAAQPLTSHAQNQEDTVYEVAFGEISPVEGTLYLPLRDALSVAGVDLADVRTSNYQGRSLCSFDHRGHVIKVRQGDAIVYVDGAPRELTAATSGTDRIYVPADFMSAAFGYSVEEGDQPLTLICRSEAQRVIIRNK